MTQGTCQRAEFVDPIPNFPRFHSDKHLWGCAGTSVIHGGLTLQPTRSKGSIVDVLVPNTTRQPQESFVSASMCRSCYGNTRETYAIM